MEEWLLNIGKAIDELILEGKTDLSSFCEEDINTVLDIFNSFNQQLTI